MKVNINLDFLDSLNNFSLEQMEKIFSKVTSDMFFLKRNKLSDLLEKSNILETDFISEINGNEKIEISSEIEINRLSHISLPSILYGYIPNTISDDKDPADVFVLFPTIYDISKIIPKTSFKIIPIFKINTIDNNERDDKIISIPSFLLNYFFHDRLVIQHVSFILSYIYTQNYYKKTVNILGVEDYEQTCLYLKRLIRK